jgi:hypothetical protein
MEGPPAKEAIGRARAAIRMSFFMSSGFPKAKVFL